jgi:erythromycin esterase-like protein
MARHRQVRHNFEDRDAIYELQSLARPLERAEDLDPLLDRIGDARFVLLGEATHGTSEFYTWRRIITQRLIEEKGFTLIGVEGDWPDCYRVNRYVKGYRDAGRNARDVLHAFERWPTWMWANEEIVELAEWLRRQNNDLHEPQKVGFYGLDVYSLWDSMHAVLQYLRQVDGNAVVAARRAFECFEPYGEDVQEYARATMWLSRSCEQPVMELLEKLREQASRRHPDDPEAFFDAEQNAIVARNAENYYRAMVQGGAPSWNVRDRHMVETLHRLMEHHAPHAKAIVWEHNTHIGDARATDMADEGMVNVGQLVREAYGHDDVVLVGFSTHRGTVVAASAWEEAMEVMEAPPAESGSWDDLLHQVRPANKLLVFHDDIPPLSEMRGHRAIGVVYRPEFERYGNYVPTALAKRYDALLCIDETHALHPLYRGGILPTEVPETYPSGM